MMHRFLTNKRLLIKWPVLLGIVITLAACESGFFAEPAREPSALNVSYSLNVAAASAAGAYDKADHARVRLLNAGSVVLDTTVAFTPSGEVRLRIPLDGPESPTTHTVEVELLHGTAVLFRGSVPLTLEEGEVASVQVELVPVVSTQVAPLPPFTAIGDTATIRAVTLFATGDTLDNPDLAFSTTNPNVITISSARLVRVVGEGTAQITVNGTGVNALPPITVTVAQEIASITVAQSLDTLDVGEQQTFTATLRDRNGNVLTNRSVAWFIQDTTIAANVGGVFSGTIIGRRAGSTMVLPTTAATANTPSQTATMMIMVRNNITQVAVSPAVSRTLLPGETQQYSAVARDATGAVISGASVRWSSSDPSIATVDSVTGLVTGVASGHTTINAFAGSAHGTATANVCGDAPGYVGGIFTLLNGAGVFKSPAAGRYNAAKVLFGGGVAFGTSPTDMVVGYDPSGRINNQVDANAPVCVMQTDGGTYTRSKVRVTKAAPTPPVIVLQETFTTGSGYVLVRYTFTSTATAPIALRVGLPLDWDLEFDGNSANDFTRFSSVNNVSEAYESTGQVVGVAGVSPLISSYRPGTNGPPTPDPATAGEFYNQFAGGIDSSTLGPRDIRQYIGWGDLHIEPGQSRAITFALVGGLDAQELSVHVNAARAATIPTVPGF